MIATTFPEANVNLAEKQEEYGTLPSFYGQIGETPEHKGFVVKFEL